MRVAPSPNHHQTVSFPPGVERSRIFKTLLCVARRLPISNGLLGEPTQREN